jgi:hypothetical protein
MVEVGHTLVERGRAALQILRPHFKRLALGRIVLIRLEVECSIDADFAA